MKPSQVLTFLLACIMTHQVVTPKIMSSKKVEGPDWNYKNFKRYTDRNYAFKKKSHDY